MKRTKSQSPEPRDTQTLPKDAKRPKIDTDEQEKNSYDCNLLDLSDDVLLNIFKFLSAFDIMALYQCCSRLNQLCCDRTLWRRVDLRSRFVPPDELQKYVTFMQPMTKFVAICGNKEQDEYRELQRSILNTIGSSCENLENLIIEDYDISREKIQITDFPKTLYKLSLEGCRVHKPSPIPMKSYLCKIDAHMPNLTCLILTNCPWLNSHSFMAISKIPKLKEVRLNSCYGLSEEVAYASLACRYGLKSLEILDLRDTFVGDSVVSSFSHTTSLTEIYLECPGADAVYNPDDNHPQEDIVYVSIQNAPDVQQNNHQPVFVLNNVNPNEVNRVPDELLPYQISDRSICALGLQNRENNQEVVNNRDEIILLQGRPRSSTNPFLTKLVVKNYAGVTNQTLVHFTANGPRLRYLDVTGTSVTREGLHNFKIQRPEVILISSFDEI